MYVKQNKGNSSATVSVESVIDSPGAIDLTTGVVKGDTKPENLVSVKIIRDSSNNAGTNNKLSLEVTSYPEELVARGFEQIQILTSQIDTPVAAGPQTPESIAEILMLTQLKKPDQILQTIDLKEYVDNFKMENLQSGIVDPQTDTLEYVPVTETVQTTVMSAFAYTPTVAPQEVSSFTDTTGVLGERLGESATTSTPESELSVESANKSESGTDANFGTSAAALPELPTMLTVLNSNELNRANRRPFSGITKNEFMMGLYSEKRKAQLAYFEKVQARPKVKAIEAKRLPKKAVQTVEIELPSSGTELKMVIYNPKNGQKREKSILKKQVYKLPATTTAMYKDEALVPNIQVAPLEGNEVTVSVTPPAGNVAKSVKVYRREISSRSWEDSYTPVSTIGLSESDGPFWFTDVLADDRIYKYVAMPVVGSTTHPVYSYMVYRTSNHRDPKSKEPIIYGYQYRDWVILTMRNVSEETIKVQLYRNSSLDGEEVFISGKFVGGKAPSYMNFYDKPSPMEQQIEYTFYVTDVNGITSPMEDRPIIKFNARIGSEPAWISSVRCKWDPDDEAVRITGVVYLTDGFQGSTTSLTNPDETTIDAAGRGLKICKLFIRRIDLLTGDDETLATPIINLGLSDIETSRRSSTSINFEYVDSSDVAITNDYSPLFPNRSYLYVCRAAAYPLSIELRTVSDISTITVPEDELTGALEYTYDPFIFDHPSNTELGILPPGVTDKSMMEIFEIAKTSSARARSVYVPSFSLDVNLQFTAEFGTDSDGGPVVVLKVVIPESLVPEIDHVEIYGATSSLFEQELIDRIFVLSSKTITYYDYQMLEQMGTSIMYQIIAIGKDFEKLFESQQITLRLADATGGGV